MKGKISKIKNTKGELALPVTTVEAVYLEDGKTKLSDEIKDVLKYEEFDDESVTAEIPSVIEEIDGIKKDIDEINSSLDNIVNDYTLINYPTNFSIIEEFKIPIFKSGNKYFTDFDIRCKKIKNGGKTYYISTLGDDNNDGLSISTPFKTFEKALSMSDIETLFVCSGNYFYKTNFSSKITVNKSINIIGQDNVNIVLGEKVTYVKHATLPNTWQISYFTDVQHIIDTKYKDENNCFVELIKVVGSADVDNTLNSFASGSNTYLRLLDNREPDDYVFVGSKSNISFTITSVDNIQSKVYMENINIIGSTVPFTIITPTGQPLKNIMYGYKCKFLNSATYNSLNSLGADTFLVECEANGSNKDGFNYHASGGKIPHSIEIDCKGIGNGRNTDDDHNNGSTTHDGGKIIRINCYYSSNQGGNVADTNSGSQSFNVGCISSNSVTSNIEKNSNYTAHENAELWLIGCKSYNSNNDLRVENNAKIHLSNSELLAGNNIVIDNGTID